MALDISQHDTIIQLQGDFVLVRRTGYPDRVFQFRHVAYPDHGELHLVYRVKGKKSVDWQVKQSILDALQPVEPNEQGIKWLLDLK